MKKMFLMFISFFAAGIFIFLLTCGCSDSKGEGEREGDAGIDVITDVCIPNCNWKGCGDDGCGGSCGINAGCSVNKCICNSGYANCDNNWSNGCETTLALRHLLWSRRFGEDSSDQGYSVSVDRDVNIYITGNYQ
ncbi:MAG: SBBP repeat-containing protein [Myxococcota bacterium]